MTEVDRIPFDVAFRAVARVHGGRDWSDQAVQKLRSDYWDALGELPIGIVQDVSAHLVKHATRWPKPADWLREADRIRNRGLVPVTSQVAPTVILEDGTTEISFHCLRCEDTGFLPDCGCDFGRLDPSFRCPRHSPTDDERKTVRMRVRACDCRQHNPTWQAHHPVKYHEDRGAA